MYTLLMDCALRTLGVNNCGVAMLDHDGIRYNNLKWDYSTITCKWVLVECKLFEDARFAI